MKLAGKVALVTGGGRGIGRGIALAFAREGADISLNYVRHPEAARETVKEIENLGRRAMAVEADVKDYEQVKKMVALTIGTYDKVDILVNNAGIVSRGNYLADTDPAEMEILIRTHLYGAFYFTKDVLPIMRKQPRGDILFITSVRARDCQPTTGPYAIAKSAMETFAKILAKEEVKHNIRVNVIGCGVVETEQVQRMLKAVLNKKVSDIAAGLPFGRVCQPEEVGNLCVFLCSEEGGYISGGDVIYIEGGVQPEFVKK